MLIALRAPLRCPFQKQRATKRRRSAAHYSLQTHKWRKTTRKPERKYCHGKLGESCLDWICCRSSRTGRWHCLISWLETQIQRVLPQIVSTHTFNQETNANNGRKEKPGEAQPNKLTNLVWSTNGPRTDLYSHAVKSKWKSKTKQNMWTPYRCVTAHNCITKAADVNQPHVGCVTLKLEMLPVRCQRRQINFGSAQSEMTVLWILMKCLKVIIDIIGGLCSSSHFVIIIQGLK